MTHCAACRNIIADLPEETQHELVYRLVCLLRQALPIPRVLTDLQPQAEQFIADTAAEGEDPNA